VRLHVRGRGLVAEVPSVVALRADGSEPIAFGDDAEALRDRTTEPISLVRVVEGGQLCRPELASALIADLLARHRVSRRARRGRCVVALRPDADVEVARQVLAGAGLRECVCVPNGAVSALGSGLPVEAPNASVVLDLGAGATEIMVVATGGVIRCVSAPFSGDHLDRLIIRQVASRHRLDITPRDAAVVKHNTTAQTRCRFLARERTTGLRKEAELGAEEVSMAMAPAVSALVDHTRALLNTLTPELAGDVAESGLVVTGGGSRLTGLAGALRTALDLSIVSAEAPEHSAIRGLAALLSRPETLARWAL